MLCKERSPSYATINTKRDFGQLSVSKELEDNLIIVVNRHLLFTSSIASCPLIVDDLNTFSSRSLCKLNVNI